MFLQSTSLSLSESKGRGVILIKEILHRDSNLEDGQFAGAIHHCGCDSFSCET